MNADEQLAALLLHADRGLLDDLAHRRLAPLADETERSRERLSETLLAWLDHQGRVPEIAAALHVHPQTVRYRLGRLRECFGSALDDPEPGSSSRWSCAAAAAPKRLRDAAKRADADEDPGVG